MMIPIMMREIIKQEENVNKKTLVVNCVQSVCDYKEEIFNVKLLIENIFGLNQHNFFMLISRFFFYFNRLPKANAWR